jgi:(S)-2-hydroxyglutarate dehydrogenase
VPAPRDLAVIGGGIVGLATAYRFQRRFPDARVRVFEKEPAPGQHQSSHNSGVLHAGLHYKPGTLKARLAVDGIRQMVAFLQRFQISHEICGKVVVAVAEEEVPRLQELFERGQKNGLQGLRWLDAQGIREIEPHSAGVAAIHVPEEGIADYPAVCRTLASEIQASGGEILSARRVTGLDVSGGGAWTISTPAGNERAEFLINCGGLFCDRIYALTGRPRSTRIVPFRGEYYRLNEEGAKLVRNLIYPVPDPQFPFLGVHYTRLIHGGIEAGPNAVLATKREGYKITDFAVGDLADTFTFGGFWKFLAKYPGTSFYEFRRSLSKAEFCRSLQRLVPEIEPEHLSPGGSGVRAQAIAADGNLVHDFEIVRVASSLHVLSAPSPAATASLAIADYILDQV